jgi:hypothetical protein
MHQVFAKERQMKVRKFDIADVVAVRIMASDHFGTSVPSPNKPG